MSTSLKIVQSVGRKKGVDDDNEPGGGHLGTNKRRNRKK